MKEFTREELQLINQRALYNSKNVKNENWIAAYMKLAAATDYLDAMIARTEDSDVQPPHLRQSV